MLLSFRHRPIPLILICGHEWGKKQPNMPLTNICGLDLDMAMLDFKPSIVAVLHVLHQRCFIRRDILDLVSIGLFDAVAVRSS